jgi:hypothetical protein
VSDRFWVGTVYAFQSGPKIITLNPSAPDTLFSTTYDLSGNFVGSYFHIIVY